MATATLAREDVSNQNDTGAATAALIGRIAIAPVFLLAALGKITHPAIMTGMIQKGGLPLPSGRRSPPQR